LCLCVSVVGDLSLYPVAFPEAKPGIVGVRLIVPLIHGIEIGRLQRPRIRQSPEPLQPFNLGNGPINVHFRSIFRCRILAGGPGRAPSVMRQYNRLEAYRTTRSKPKFWKKGSQKYAKPQILFDNEQLFFQKFRNSALSSGPGQLWQIKNA
jgi:hypothetical protein